MEPLEHKDASTAPSAAQTPVRARPLPGDLSLRAMMDWRLRDWGIVIGFTVAVFGIGWWSRGQFGPATPTQTTERASHAFELPTSALDAFRRAARVPERAAFSVQLVPDENCVSCTRLSRDLKARLEEAGWAIARFTVFVGGRAERDIPGVYLVYDESAKPEGAATLERALDVAGLDYEVKRRDLRPETGRLFLGINPLH